MSVTRTYGNGGCHRFWLSMLLGVQQDTLYLAETGTYVFKQVGVQQAWTHGEWQAELEDAVNSSTQVHLLTVLVQLIT